MAIVQRAAIGLLDRLRNQQPAPLSLITEQRCEPLRIARYDFILYFMVIRKFCLVGILAVGLSGMVTAENHPAPPSRIQSALSSTDYASLLADETLVFTTLRDVPESPDLEIYRAGAAISVDAPVSVTRDILTQYEIYQELIPFIDHVEVLEDPSQVTLEGGIFGWKMISLIQFDDKEPGWVHFTITQGSYKGMQGDFYFEERPGQPSKSLVYFGVNHSAEHFPPRFIMEFGAGIIFWFTANRMQAYIEERQPQSR